MSLSVHPYSAARRVLLLAISALAVISVAEAQHRRHELMTRVDRKVQGSGYGLLTTARTTTLTVDTKAFAEVATSNLLLAGVPLSPERSVDLDLTEFSVLDAESIVTYSDDHGRHPIEKLSVRTYRGTVTGESGSEVFLAIADQSVVGLITTEGKTYQIATDFSAPKRAGQLAAVAFPTSDLPDQKFTCGVKDQPFSKEELESFHEAGLQSASECPTLLYAVRGAFDADYEFYQEWLGTDPSGQPNGGIEGAASYMISLISGMSQIFERDARFQIVIASMNIWTSSSDPYNETSFMPIALDEAEGIWASQQTPRGFTQIMSAKDWNGIIGIANGFDLICNQTESITFQLVKKWDPIGSIAVLAHELGHLTGLRHTHSCTWNPHIDECAAAESGSCFAGTTLTEGTIMSYCKQKLMKIHERQIPFLRNRVNGWSSCTADARKLEIARTLLHFPVVDINNPLDSVFEYFFVNRSRGPVEVSRMVLQGDIYNQFEVLAPETPFTVGSCDSIGLRLKFKAERDTTHRARLHIFHDGLNVNWGRDQQFVVDVEAFAKNDQPAFGFLAQGDGRVNFGTVKVDATIDSVFKSPKELFINIGRAVLRADSTAIVGPDREEFELLEGAAPFALEPFQKRRATIRFTPKTHGEKKAWLVVWSNSPDNPIDSLELTATVLRGPVLDLKIGDLVIDFGEVVPRRTYDTSFDNFFYNNGTEDLSINAGVAGEHAELFPGTQWLEELPPGEGMPMSLSFFAPEDEELGWKTALLIIASNTPKELDTVRVSAKLVAPASAPGAVAGETAMFMIIPNPTPGQADIMIAPAAGELGRDYTFTITDGTGKELRRETGRFTSAGIRTSIQAGDLPSGVYRVSVATSRGLRSHSITITR